MHIQHSDFATSPALRTSLKRGLARQVIAQARRDEADLAGIFVIATAARPNRKAYERLATRLGRVSGVVRAAMAKDGQGIVVTARNLREVVTRAQAQDVFSETALIYTRIAVRCDHRGVRFRVSRAAFCLHALERLVERSSVALNGDLMTEVDTEASSLLRKLSENKTIHDSQDTFISALGAGVWAGSLDATELEPDWDLSYDDAEARVPVFSARTFLGPDQMRPTVYLAWKNDPAMQVSCR